MKNIVLSFPLKLWSNSGAQHLSDVELSHRVALAHSEEALSSHTGLSGP